mgnify:CR=1 FL=1|jgi:hypothetical protein
MKKLIIFLILVLFLVSSCAKEVVVEKQLEPVEVPKTSAGSESLCENVDIDYQISKIETEITPRPSPAQREYDSGYLSFSILNKDNDINGYFNVSIKCLMQKENTIEYKYFNLNAGDREGIKLQCSKRGRILSIEGPTIESAPTKEIC